MHQIQFPPCPECGHPLLFVEGALRCLRCGHAKAKRKADAEERYAYNVEVARAAHKNLLKNIDGSWDYALRRGITPDAIETWGIGYLPKEHGFQLVFGEYDDGTPKKDSFWRRLIFPVKSLKGDTVVGFVGRIIDPVDRPKYVNTSSHEDSKYTKGDILYGYSLVERNPEVLCVAEGPLDTLSMWSHGYTVVGTLGCCPTTAQIGLILRKKPENICIAYDSDVAGRNAKRKTIARLTEVGYSQEKVFCLSTPEAKDIDEALVKGSPVEVLTALEWLDKYGKEEEK